MARSHVLGLGIGARDSAISDSSQGLVQIVTSPVDPTLKLLGQGYVQLFYAPAGTEYRDFHFPTMLKGAAWLEANPGWTLGPVTAISSIPGFFDRGVVELPGITPGSAMDYVVIGWKGTALTFDEAMQADLLYGVSTPKQSILTGGLDPSLPPPELASQGLLLYIGAGFIPEPSSFALAGLGAMAFWLWKETRPPASMGPRVYCVESIIESWHRAAFRSPEAARPIHAPPYGQPILLRRHDREHKSWKLG